MTAFFAFINIALAQHNLHITLSSAGALEPFKGNAFDLWQISGRIDMPLARNTGDSKQPTK